MKRRVGKTRTTRLKRNKKTVRRVKGGDRENNEAAQRRKNAEVAEFRGRIESVRNEQKGVPKVHELIKLFRSFNQSIELIKNKKLRDMMKSKILEFDEVDDQALRIYVQQNKEYQTLRNLILQRINDYEARLRLNNNA